MPAPLTPAGEAAIAELAQRYRVTEGAVRALLDGVIRGGGSMAQFSHPDLGGSGQWMRGGMTMVGDMFNPGLQATVSGICSELSAQIADGAILVSHPQGASAGSGVGGLGDSWWPPGLGRPSSSGGQNDAAYAYFPGSRRLAIRRGQAVTLYDTGDHAISGVQQQQGGRGLLEFSSQYGSFTVDTLPVLPAEDVGPGMTATPTTSPAAPVPEPDHSASAPTVPAEPPAAPAAATAAPPSATTVVPPPAPLAGSAPPPAGSAPPPAGHVPPPAAPAAPPPVGGATTASDIGAAIETLAGLRDKGLLTDDEFTAKKTELLARL